MIDDDSAVAGGSERAVPAKPCAPHSERPVARALRAKAQELVERLATEGRIRIAAPDGDEVAACSQLSEAARPGTGE
ncbi:hypothetical protein AB0E08_49795 [Streptomyces sp. NPDC048281]|uniref:hypothetical protein n=1 Tax=Streptomyces sp. NPDC048281 TaxID=3154715 RepID=UPI0034122082